MIAGIIILRFFGFPTYISFQFFSGIFIGYKYRPGYSDGLSLPFSFAGKDEVSQSIPRPHHFNTKRNESATQDITIVEVMRLGSALNRPGS